MSIDLERQRQAILRVCHAETPLEALARFVHERTILNDCKFVFATDHGNAPGRAVHRDFPEGAAVRSLFATQHILVLDRDTIAEMQQGQSTFGIDYSISLDTQALSYLLPFLNRNTSKLPADITQVFTFIADPNTNVDPTPYRLENLLNLTKQPEYDARIYDRLRAYEILRTLDPQALAKGHPASTLTDFELTKRTQQQMASLYDWLDTPLLLERVRFKHATMYALLLKMCAIQLARPEAAAESKIIEFCAFCDEELATLYAREILIARRYFERGQNLGFFGKIMIRGKDMLKRLHGMAWDLWHVRWLEKAMTLKPSTENRYFFPALLTFDKSLVEVIDLYPLRAFAYSTRQNEPHAIFEGDWLAAVSGDDITRQHIIDRFYSDDAISRRAARRDGQKKMLHTLVSRLESDFKCIAKV
jgi:hypothetical protein